MEYDAIIFTDMQARTWHTKSLGAYRIASELRQHGYNVKVVDHLGDWLRNLPDFYRLLDTIVSDKTVLMGFSGTFFADLGEGSFTNVVSYKDYSSKQHSITLWPVPNQQMMDVFEYIRDKFPLIKFAYGGMFRTGKIKHLKNQVDFIVRGFGDKMILDLMEHLKSNAPLKYLPTFGRAKLLEYDMLGQSFDFATSRTVFIDDDNIYPNEVMPIETSRGCLFKCSFCAFPLLGRKKSDPCYHRAVDILSEEFKYNYDKFSINKYMFVDDTFNESTSKIEEILKARDASGVDIKFSAYLRADLLHRFPEQIPLLAELGIESAFLGIETLYGPSGKAINKHSDPERIKDCIHNMKSIWKNDVSILGSFIVGLPEDNPDTLNTWVPWIEDKNCPIDHVIINPLLIDESGLSEISKYPEKFGYEITYDSSGKTSWKNKHWTYSDAERVAHDISERCWSSGRNKVGGWDIIGLQNSGYTLKELINLPMKDLNFLELSLKINEQWLRYKKTMLNE